MVLVFPKRGDRVYDEICARWKEMSADYWKEVRVRQLEYRKRQGLPIGSELEAEKKLKRVALWRLCYEDNHTG